MTRRFHATAGSVAFLTIVAFWCATVWSELFGNAAAIAAVKAAILKGMAILIPALTITGATGFRLAAGSSNPLVSAKKRRMPFIAANGLLILLPSAFYLAGKAAAGTLDTAFYAVQVLELAAGAINITLLGQNLRDGLRLAGRLGR